MREHELTIIKGRQYAIDQEIAKLRRQAREATSQLANASDAALRAEILQYRHRLYQDRRELRQTAQATQSINRALKNGEPTFIC